MESLSPGKIRALQACASPQGVFSILAIDHRDSLRAILAPEAPRSVAAETLTNIKMAIEQRVDFLAKTARQRLADLNQIALDHGIARTTWYSETQVDESWFLGY